MKKNRVNRHKSQGHWSGMAHAFNKQNNKLKWNFHHKWSVSIYIDRRVSQKQNKTKKINKQKKWNEFYPLWQAVGWLFLARQINSPIRCTLCLFASEICADDHKQFEIHSVFLECDNEDKFDQFDVFRIKITTTKNCPWKLCRTHTNKQTFDYFNYRLIVFDWSLRSACMRVR